MKRNTLIEESSQIKNQIDEWLSSKIDNKNQKEPIIKLAEEVLKRYKEEVGNLNPPIDLIDLGECLDIKVKKILLSKDINCDALLIPIVGGFKIKLKNEDKLHSTYRTRFSCAHEMAHTFFYEIEDGGVPFRAVPGGSKYEEKLCDIAAAELLMPKDALEKKANKLVNRYGYSFSTLLKLKETFKTSLRSIAIRVTNNLDNGWRNYLIAKLKPIYESNKPTKIIAFEKEWESKNIKNMNIALRRMIDEKELIFDIFKEMINQRGKKVSKYIYENDFCCNGINIKVALLNEGYIRNTSFLLMIPINEYLKTLQYSGFGDEYLKRNIILDFDFEEKTSKRQKVSTIKEKKGVADFM